MELRIDFSGLPEGKTLMDLRRELDDVLADDGWLVGSGQEGEQGFVELELDEDKVNPKYGIVAVKNYLQKAGFAPETTMEIAGAVVPIYQ